MPTIDVRPRTEADLPGAVAALRAVHERDAYPAVWQDDAAGWLSPPGCLAAWVAVRAGASGGEVVGHVVLEPGPGSGTAAVARLFSAPAARGAGLGTRLLDVASAAARERGLRPVLEVDAGATAAVALYERAGWRRTGSRPATWTRADGRPVQVHDYAAPPAR